MEKLNREIKYFVKSYSNLHLQGKKKNIFIFSTPRGGSTWLMELIAAQPRIKYFDEPLNLRRDDVKRLNYFKNWQALGPDKKNSDKIVQYFKLLEKNKLKFMNPPPFTRRNHKIFSNRIVFKIHEIEHLMNYINDQLDCHIVYLLRHPIANTISRYAFPRLEFFIQSKFYQEKIL